MTLRPIEPARSVRQRLGLVAPLLAALLCMAAPMALAQTVVEAFGRGLGGWTSSDGPASLQNRGGALCVTDRSAGWLTLYAPSRFHGLWGATGGKISFRVKADNGTVRHALVVKISGRRGSATHSIAPSRLSAGAWVPVSIDVEAAKWKVRGDWRHFTRNVTSVSIRIDLTDKYTGDEVSCIDDVRLIRGRAGGAELPVWDKTAKRWRIKDLYPTFHTSSVAADYQRIAARLSMFARDCEWLRFMGHLRALRDDFQKKHAANRRKSDYAYRRINRLNRDPAKYAGQIQQLGEEIGRLDLELMDIIRVESILGVEIFASEDGFKKGFKTGSPFVGCVKEGQRKSPAPHSANLSHAPR